MSEADAIRVSDAFSAELPHIRLHDGTRLMPG